MSPAALSDIIIPNGAAYGQQASSDASGAMEWRDPSSGWYPRFNKLFSAVHDPGIGGSGGAMVAGVAATAKCPLRRSRTYGTAWWAVFTAGSAAANAYLAIYDSTGSRRGVTANQATAMNSTGQKSAAYTQDAGKSLTIDPTGPDDFVLLLCLVGSATTLPQLLRGASNYGNIGLVTADVYRYGTYGTGLTAAPASLVLANIGSRADTTWLGAD